MRAGTAPRRFDGRDYRDLDPQAWREEKPDTSEAEVDEVHGQGRNQDRDRPAKDPAANELVECEGKYVEGRVVAKDRFDDAEGDRVPEPQEDHPLGGGERSEEGAQEDGYRHRAPGNKLLQELVCGMG